jgi:hypothetical protein
MAFALSIKSKQDFPAVGSIFLLLTLILSSFTLLYSSVLLETTIVKCEIGSSDNHRDYGIPSSNNCFVRLKNAFGSFNSKYLMKSVDRSESSEDAGSGPSSPQGKRIELNEQQRTSKTDSDGKEMGSLVLDAKGGVKDLLDSERI